MPSYDPVARRKSKRAGREKGCWLYIAAEDLERMGLAGTWPIFYRTWPANRRGRVVVGLYREG